ncbi:MAG TPA: hypothetical protein VN607_08000 [Gemmatimonadaceae bacterium]|nr:hypothetical protein [Gemmatimonadaceae bacterium]
MTRDLRCTSDLFQTGVVHLDKAAVFLELLPVLAAMRLSRALPVALRLVALVYALWFLQDCVMWWLADAGRNNLWISHIALPVTTGLLMWAFSLWQEDGVARMAFRIAIPLYVLVWLFLLWRVERLDHFSTYASPLACLLLICMAAYTLVTASLRSRETVWRQEWLWIGSGFLLYYGGEVVLMPLSNILFAAHRELHFVYQLFGALGILSTLLVTWGILCAPSHSISADLTGSGARGGSLLMAKELDWQRSARAGDILETRDDGSR